MAAAAAAQKAPEQKRGTERPDGKKAEARAPRIGQAAGIAILVLLLCVSLAAGNWRALSKATPKAFLRGDEVALQVEERVSGARNAESVAKRADLEETLYSEVEAAARELEGAKTARAVSRADQRLASAVGEMTLAATGYFGENADLTRAMDMFDDAGNRLRYSARAYNEGAEKAKRVYDGLPLRMLFPEPDYYEGL